MSRLTLDQLYSDILARGRTGILLGGSTDPSLLHPQDDTRMSVTLVFRIPAWVSAAVHDTLRPLREAEAGLYYYPCSDYHVTVLDILRGRPGLQAPHTDWILRYTACITQAVAQTRRFPVEFCGLVASDSAVIAKGYYDTGLEELRQAIRRSLAANGLALEERYQTVSCHATVVRFPHKIQNPPALLDFLATKQAAVFGSFPVESIELVYHNWYDSRKQVLATIALAE